MLNSNRSSCCSHHTVFIWQCILISLFFLACFTLNINGNVVSEIPSSNSPNGTMELSSENGTETESKGQGNETPTLRQNRTNIESSESEISIGSKDGSITNNNTGHGDFIYSEGEHSEEILHQLTLTTATAKTTMASEPLSDDDPSIANDDSEDPNNNDSDMEHMDSITVNNSTYHHSGSSSHICSFTSLTFVLISSLIYRVKIV